MLMRTVITDANGAPRGVVVASLDTTERHAMEEKLAGEQRRAALIVRAANVGILDWDGIKRTVYYSPRFKEILRYPPDADTSGWPDYFDMVHPEDKERVHGSFREQSAARARKGPRRCTSRIQYRLRRADGTYVWVRGVRRVGARRDAATPTRFIASISDISERRFQEEALRAAVRLREEVERMSRHDLKTPINSVIAMSRLLREEGRLAREDDELLGIIERAGLPRAEHGEPVARPVRAWSRAATSSAPRPVDMAEVARRVAADLQSQAASKGVSVQLRAAGATSAHAEEPLCYSMLANLIKNAIEASPESGAVTVTVEPARAKRSPCTCTTTARCPKRAAALLPEVRHRRQERRHGAGRLLGAPARAHPAGRAAAAHVRSQEGTTLTVQARAAPPRPARRAAGRARVRLEEDRAPAGRSAGAS